MTYRPGSNLAIWAHVGPSLAYASKRMLSSTVDHGPLQMLGSRWFCHLHKSTLNNDIHATPTIVFGALLMSSTFKTRELAVTIHNITRKNEFLDRYILHGAVWSFHDHVNVWRTGRLVGPGQKFSDYLSRPSAKSISMLYCRAERVKSVSKWAYEWAYFIQNPLRKCDPSPQVCLQMQAYKRIKPAIYFTDEVKYRIWCK